MTTLLLSQDEPTIALLTEAAGGHLKVAPWRSANGLDASVLVDQVPRDGPAVVVLGPDIDIDRALEVASALDEQRPEIEVLLVAHPTTRLWETALRAGVRGILQPSHSVEEARDIIERAVSVARRRRANLTGEGMPETGRVIVVLSPKGGAGKTTIATNLAVGLARTMPRQVVLFDCDLQFGDVANALRLIPDATFGDSVRAGLPDVTALKAALTPHPTGVFALCAPETPAEADEITGEHVGRAIDMLRTSFAVVVVDSDGGLGERTLASIEHATDLIFVCSTDVPSVRSLRKELEALDLIGMTHQARHFVLNRADAKVGLSVDDIQATVNQAIDVFIPSSRTVPVSLNKGSPILESDTASAAARALLPLVNRFANGALPPAKEPAGHRKNWHRRKEG